MAEQWLSIVEYARAFSLSDMTVRRRIKNGKINAVLKDGKYYIPVAAEKPANSPTPRPQMHRPAVRPTTPPPVTSGYAPEFEVPVVPRDYPEHKPMPKVTPPPMPAYHVPPTPPPTYNYAMPEAVTKPPVQHEQTLVHTQQLLNFCNNALKKQELLEKQIGEKFSARIASLESTLKARDLEIGQLKQQIEDLQLLVKVFEK